MIIPNVRNRYVESICPNTYGAKRMKREINPYWDGYLGEIDSAFIKGFDWIYDIEVAAFFNNLEVYEDDLKDILDLDNVDSDIIEESIAFETDVEWKSVVDYSEEELKAMSKETKLLLILKSAFRDALEDSRNNLVISLIESMPDEKYQEIRAKRDLGAN